jgi:thiol-disulfide isomerase/thioredoxin
LTRILHSLFFAGLATLVCSQGYQLEFYIENMPDQDVYLSAYDKTEYTKVDSMYASNESFYFFLPEFAEAGMYRIDFTSQIEGSANTSNAYIEFIWAHESFQVSADFLHLATSASFGNSIENEILGVFRDYEEIYVRKITELFRKKQDPASDVDNDSILASYRKLHDQRNKYYSELAQHYPDLYSSQIILSYRSVFSPPGMSAEEQVLFMKEHYFDSSPLTNPALLKSPIYTSKIIDYLKLYRGEGLSFKEQESAFMEAVDVIMANTSGDPELRSFVVEYLLEGFESFGMERVQTYIVDTYVDETCTTDAVELAMERVMGYRKMAEGEIAEDIYIRGADNSMIRLSEQDNDYTLVIFWATYCEHCTKLIPKLLEWYYEEKPDGLDVFAISIDTSRTEWERYMALASFPWINAIEPMGWEGKSPEDYNVYATPTMFLLDRQRRIVAKPYTLRELKREVNKLYK